MNNGTKLRKSTHADKVLHAQLGVLTNEAGESRAQEGRAL